MLDNTQDKLGNNAVGDIEKCDCARGSKYKFISIVESNGNGKSFCILNKPLMKLNGIQNDLDTVAGEGRSSYSIII